LSCCKKLFALGGAPDGIGGGGVDGISESSPGTSSGDVTDSTTGAATGAATGTATGAATSSAGAGEVCGEDFRTNELLLFEISAITV